MNLKTIRTDTLEIAFEEHGPADGWPVILSHGFPYDVIDVDRQGHAFPPSLECVMWYQHLFQTKRGRECLDRHRRDLCRMLWEQALGARKISLPNSSVIIRLMNEP